MVNFVSFDVRILVVIAGIFATIPEAKSTKNSTGLTLSREILEISYEAAKLSNIAYLFEEELSLFGVREQIDRATLTRVSHPDFDSYDYLNFYTQEPDQAVVGKRDGICYVAYRGTTGRVSDLLQNLNLNARLVYRDNNSSSESCESRKGFVDFLDSDAVLQGFEDVYSCMNSTSCENTTEESCLVVTGHSQGGASATVASILLYSLHPTLITFGQPPTIDGGCESIPSQRYYRYINSVKEEGEDDDVGFDPIVYSPDLFSMAEPYGHAILLGEDAKAVKYLGLDGNADFAPSFFDRQNEIAAHTIGSESDNDYDSRIGALLENYPITTDGFSDGAFCDRGYPDLCASGFCSPENECTPKVADKSSSASTSVCSMFMAVVSALSIFLFS